MGNESCEPRVISSFKATSHRVSRAWWLVDVPCPSEQLAIMLITRGGWLNFQLCRQPSSPCLKSGMLYSEHEENVSGSLFAFTQNFAWLLATFHLAPLDCSSPLQFTLGTGVYQNYVGSGAPIYSKMRIARKTCILAEQGANTWSSEVL